MVGSLFAWLSIALTLATIFVEESQVVAALVGGFVALLIAVWRRGRPVFLLLAFVLFSLAFIILPSAMDRIVKIWIPQHDWYDLLHEPLGLLVAILLVACLFTISCRRQSGGVWLSAQEASEDLSRFLSFMGYLTALLFVPLLLLALLSVTRGSPAAFDVAGLSWLNPERLLVSRDEAYLSWFTTIFLLGGLGLAYIRNAHHRRPCRLEDNHFKRKAWQEFIGGVLFLLPICWTAVKQGCLFAIEIHQGREIGPDVALTVGGQTVPEWILVAIFPFAFLLLSLAAISVMLRSLVYLYGPHYLSKRAASHIDMPDSQSAFRASRFGRKTESQGMEGKGG
ncbi:TRAP-type mannitol/chloroaromatic compound transport system, small permease component [Cohaesibacter sp. ES.047]|uniref:hypothetical protein n=1 Tax=Cohaesibacter sp. ES.047 TaxID=1798205 RepID=UPI000BB7A889|nr:hypothetical protein [Cohaesibacter sp. ES.047]SNY92078.1 TRAP-type mannitol/chloroaromatic compound transport system, small permease component [Cohaesibacter sp. ES.047]